MRAQTDPECRPADTDARGDGSQLLGEEGVGVFFVDSDRTAQHDDEVGVRERIGGDWVDSGVEIGDLVAVLGQHGSDQSEVFEE